ncbi:putative RNA-directed DNA polymerase [Aphis craccivora]|uniref:Putative RNA-directed DNA polymerase n=1 Tax=Aphis craccivora TaxID=307492 RepID=A0A6G0ZB94_APHCR|nr:putative RNA-directed DNA polymerase [Aphis craccivora]
MDIITLLINRLQKNFPKYNFIVHFFNTCSKFFLSLTFYKQLSINVFKKELMIIKNKNHFPVLLTIIISNINSYILHSTRLGITSCELRRKVNFLELLSMVGLHSYKIDFSLPSYFPRVLMLSNKIANFLDYFFIFREVFKSYVYYALKNCTIIYYKILMVRQ